MEKGETHCKYVKTEKKNVFPEVIITCFTTLSSSISYFSSAHEEGARSRVRRNKSVIQVLRPRRQELEHSSPTPKIKQGAEEMAQWLRPFPCNLPTISHTHARARHDGLCPGIPALRSQSREAPWSLLASQLSLMGSFQVR